MVIDDNLKYKIAKESGNEDSSVVQIIRIISCHFNLKKVYYVCDYINNNHH